MSNLIHLKADPLFLFPGMGADGRMFAPLRSAVPQLVTPDWIEPERHEPLVEYARRLARAIDPGRPCFVGGASFGGVIALEMSAVLQTRACFLIGSMRSPEGLPWQLKALRPLTPLTVLLPWFGWAVPPLAGAAFGPLARNITQQLADTNARFLRWAATAILTWKPSPEVADVPVCQIHGDRDHVFPFSRAKPDCIVPGAGHVLSVTHPTATSEFLLACMRTAIPPESVEGCARQKFRRPVAPPTGASQR